MRADRRVLETGRVSNMLGEVDWSRLPAVMFSEIICKTLIKYKKELSENSVNITGELAKIDSSSPSGESTPEQRSVSGKGLANKIKQRLRKNPGLFGGNKRKADKLKPEDITDDMILKQIEIDLVNVCKGITKKYDKKKYDTIVKTADKATFVSNSTGLWTRLFKDNSYDAVINRISGDEVESKRDKVMMKHTKKDVDSLASVMLSLVKRQKDINENNLILGNLSKLLFESNLLSEESKFSISADDLKGELQSSGTLMYGDSDLKETSKEFIEAENYLLGTISAYLKSNFDIEVTGVDQFKQLNLNSVVAEEIVNQDAPEGEPASPQIAKETKDTPAPKDMNQPFDPNQFLALMNNCGGNPMFAFMMMMMQNPQMMQQLQGMQKSGGTIGDAVKLVSAESEELSGLDKLMDTAIKAKRRGRPLINVSEAKKLYKLIDSGDLFEKLPNVQRVGFTNRSGSTYSKGDSDLFMELLGGRFKVTKEDVSYEASDVETIHNLITSIYDLGKDRVSYNNNNVFDGAFNNLRYAIYLAAEKILNTGNTRSAQYKNGECLSYHATVDKNNDGIVYGLMALFNQFANVEDTGDNVVKQLKTVYDVTITDTSGTSPYEFASEDDLKKFKKALSDSFSGVESAIGSLTLTESRYSRKRVLPVRKKKVLRSKKVSKIKTESNFLVQEYRRLWNLK